MTESPARARIAEEGAAMSEHGRPVPPHASGGGMGYWQPPHIYRRDPDETNGRRLYRNIADAEARRQLAYERHRVRLKKDDADE